MNHSKYGLDWKKTSYDDRPYVILFYDTWILFNMQSDYIIWLSQLLIISNLVVSTQQII